MTRRIPDVAISRYDPPHIDDRPGPRMTVHFATPIAYQLLSAFGMTMWATAQFRGEIWQKKELILWPEVGGYELCIPPGSRVWRIELYAATIKEIAYIQPPFSPISTTMQVVDEKLHVAIPPLGVRIRYPTSGVQRREAIANQFKLSLPKPKKKDVEESGDFD